MRLEVRLDDDNETLVLSLNWNAGLLTEVYATESLKEAVVCWQKQGISEWIPLDESPNQYPRYTAPSDPEFLPRLKDYIARQSGLHVLLSSP